MKILVLTAFLFIASVAHAGVSNISLDDSAAWFAAEPTRKLFWAEFIEYPLMDTHVLTTQWKELSPKKNEVGFYGAYKAQIDKIQIESDRLKKKWSEAARALLSSTIFLKEEISTIAALIALSQKDVRVIGAECALEKLNEKKPLK